MTSTEPQSFEDDLDVRFAELRRWAETQGMSVLLVLERAETNEVFLNVNARDDGVIGEMLDDAIRYADESGARHILKSGMN